jgi:hypothetical protein
MGWLWFYSNKRIAPSIASRYLCVWVVAIAGIFFYFAKLSHAQNYLPFTSYRYFSNTNHTFQFWIFQSWIWKSSFYMLFEQSWWTLLKQCPIKHWYCLIHDSAKDCQSPLAQMNHTKMPFTPLSYRNYNGLNLLQPSVVVSFGSYALPRDTFPWCIVWAEAHHLLQNHLFSNMHDVLPIRSI